MNYELLLFFGERRTCYDLVFNCGFELSFGGHFVEGGREWVRGVRVGVVNSSKQRG